MIMMILPCLAHQATIQSSEAVTLVVYCKHQGKAACVHIKTTQC